MKLLLFNFLQALWILLLVLGAACLHDRDNGIPNDNVSNGVVVQDYGREVSLHGRQVDPFSFVFTMIFFVLGLMGLGQNIHGWLVCLLV